MLRRSLSYTIPNQPCSIFWWLDYLWRVMLQPFIRTRSRHPSAFITSIWLSALAHVPDPPTIQFRLHRCVSLSSSQLLQLTTLTSLTGEDGGLRRPCLSILLLLTCLRSPGDDEVPHYYTQKKKNAIRACMRCRRLKKRVRTSLLWHTRIRRSDNYTFSVLGNRVSIALKRTSLASGSPVQTTPHRQK